MLSNKKEAGYKEGLLLIATFIIYNIKPNKIVCKNGESMIK